MRFVDLLRSTVLLSAAAATVLGALCVASARADGDLTPVLAMAVWWVVAAAVGGQLGRRAQTTPPISRLLADARSATTLPELQPALTLLNRLWPLLMPTILAGALAFLAPQIPGIAAGFAIIWALAWRRQDAAVSAIEERDGVTFFVERTGVFKPAKLVRTPGFRRDAEVLTSRS